MDSSELKQFVYEITAPEVHSSINIIPEHRTILYGTKSCKRHSTQMQDQKKKSRTPYGKQLQKRLKESVILPRELKFKDLLPLYDTWNNYVTNLLNIKEGKEIPTVESPEYPQLLRNLSKIDFHGALIRIFEAKCSSHVGIQGLIIRELKNIMEILCTDNCIRKIPKTCIFMVYINNVPFIVHGIQLMNKVARRSRRKLKRFVAESGA